MCVICIIFLLLLLFLNAYVVYIILVWVRSYFVNFVILVHKVKLNEKCYLGN